MPKVSVIVPVYNVERYLSLCLDSIRKQSLADIEIVCVIDGSTDRSIHVAQAHAALDGRIRIVEKENGGLSSARNAGMAAASGNYLMFVDSDDLLERRACETVAKAFEDNDAEVVTFGAKCVPHLTFDAWLDKTISPRDVVYHGFDERLLFDENSRPFAWRTAISASFAKREGISFDEEVPFGEDQVFHFDIYPLAKTTALISDRLYVYRFSRKDSLMSTYAFNTERVPQHTGIVETILEHWKNRDLLDLCPTRMIDWIYEFLGWDLLSLPEPKRTECAAKLGQVLKTYFDDPVGRSSDISPLLGEVTSDIIAASDSGTAVPDEDLTKYTRFRLGRKQMLRDKFDRTVLSKFHRNKGASLNAADLRAHFDYGVAQTIAESELATSLQLLALETAAKAKKDGR